MFPKNILVKNKSIKKLMGLKNINHNDSKNNCFINNNNAFYFFISTR